MKKQNLKLLAMAMFVFSSNANAAEPPVSVMVKQTIVNVFDIAQDGTGVDRFQLAIQPLLFALHRTHDEKTEQSLADLSWYRLGEANDEIYRCILQRHPTALSRAVKASSDDCRKQLNKSAMCADASARRAMLDDVQSRRKHHEACDLEY